MGSIVFQIAGNKNGVSPALQAIKVFSNKNKGTKIYVVGNQKDLVTLEKRDNVIPVSAYDEGDDKPTNLDYIYDKAWSVLTEQKADVLISFADRRKLKESAEKNLNKVSCPAYIAYFLSNSPSRFCLLADCGYHPTLSLAQYQALLEETKIFAKDVFSFPTTKFALISGSEDQQEISEEEQGIDEFFQNQEDYMGLATPEKMMEGKSDIYLADGKTASCLISAMFSIYQMYDAKFQQYRKDDFMAKIAFSLGGKMISTINSSTSAKLDQSGLMLVGFDKLVIKAKENTNFGGVLATLNNAQKYLFTLIKTK